MAWVKTDHAYIYQVASTFRVRCAIVPAFKHKEEYTAHANYINCWILQAFKNIVACLHRYFATRSSGHACATSVLTGRRKMAQWQKPGFCALLPRWAGCKDPASLLSILFTNTCFACNQGRVPRNGVVRAMKRPNQKRTQASIVPFAAVCVSCFM